MEIEMSKKEVEALAFALGHGSKTPFILLKMLFSEFCNVTPLIGLKVIEDEGDAITFTIDEELVVDTATMCKPIVEAVRASTTLGNLLAPKWTRASKLEEDT